MHLSSVQIHIEFIQPIASSN